MTNSLVTVMALLAYLHIKHSYAIETKNFRSLFRNGAN